MKKIIGVKCMRLVRQLSLLLGLSTASIASTGIVDTLKTVDQVYFDVIAGYIFENKSSLCLNFLDIDNNVRDNVRDNVSDNVSDIEVDIVTDSKPIDILGSAFTITDMKIQGDTRQTYGYKEYKKDFHPYVAYVEDLAFRSLLGNILTERNQNILVKYSHLHYVPSNRFVLVDYQNVVGIVTFFEEGSTNPVILLSGDMKDVIDPHVLSVEPAVLDFGCQVM